MIDLPVAWQWAFWLSLITFAGSLAVLPVLIVRLPSDYFLGQRPPTTVRHPLARVVAIVAKNLLGLLFAIAGIVMLVTPGQGILTLLVGLSLLDFPGKRTLERRVLSIPKVYRTLNRIRARAGQPPLRLPKPTQPAGKKGPIAPERKRTK